MAKNGKKEITLEDLAGMVANGFREMITKEDLRKVEVELKSELRALDKRLGKVEFRVDDIHDILKQFEENDILNLQKRVQILEKAVRALASQTK